MGQKISTTPIDKDLQYKSRYSLYYLIVRLLDPSYQDYDSENYN